MKSRKKKVLVSLLVIIIITVISYFGYQYYGRKRPAGISETDKMDVRKEMAINDLVKRYGALTDWNKDIHLTIQLQDLLVSPGKPVLFTGYLDDIFMKKDEYYARFRTGGLWSSDYSGTEIYFILECDSGKISKIMDSLSKEEEGFLFFDFDEYVVIAEVEDVTKPIFKIGGYPGWIEGEEEYHIVELEYEPSSVFIASGTCIDFIMLSERQEVDE